MKFNADYKETLRVVVMGELENESMARTVALLEKLLSQQEYANLQGFVFCTDAANENEFISKYKNSVCENIVFVDEGGSYRELLCDMCKQAGFDAQSVTDSPCILFIDGQDTVKFVATKELTKQDLTTALDELSKPQTGEIVSPKESVTTSDRIEGDEVDAVEMGATPVEADGLSIGDSQATESETIGEAQRENGTSPLAVEGELVSGNFKYTLYDGNYAKITGYVYKPTDPMLDIPETLDGHVVETIGINAFKDCSSFARIAFPSTLVTIEEGAFDNCDGLVEVEFPTSVEAINGQSFVNGGSFANCDKLSKISLPKGGVGCFIGSGSFANNPRLNTVHVPDGLRCDNVWTGSPFEGTPISNVSFEPGITEIPGNIFGRCESLTSVTIPSTVVSIGDSAFSRCTSLAKIEFPDSVEKIGAGAFNNCDSLTEVVFPKSVTVIGGDISNFNDGAFANCDNLAKITLPQGGEGCLLGGNAFSNDPMLKSVFIPKGVSCDTYWYFGAFPNSGLENVTFETGIDSIPWNLFKNCTALSKVVIPETVKTIEGAAFSGCLSLTSVSLPTGLRKIEDSAFESCKRLPSIVLPDSLAEIGSRAFSDCEKLVSLKLPNNTETGCTINQKAFSNCTRLTTIHIPKLLKTNALILQVASPFFESGITSVTFENGIEAIPDGLFGNCTSLASIDLPNTVKSIGNDAFINCDALTSVSLPASLEKMGSSVFQGCERVVSIFIPEHVSIIGANTFSSCPKLEKVQIPFGVTEIGRNAFSNSPKVSIEGYKTSYAETYANQNSIPFVSLPLPREMKYTVVDSVSAQVYTGSTLTPDPKVTFEGKTLVKDVDYVISYKDNVNAGTASMTIAGKGAYAGSKTLTFRIVAASMAKASVDAIADQVFAGKSLTPKPVVKLGEKALKEGADYALSYQANVNAGTASVTITGKGSLSGTKTVSFNIVPANIGKTVTVSAVTSKVYTGKAITPKPGVTFDGKTLKEGSDYTISYKSNINVGNATLTIVGKDNYVGSKAVSFEVVAADIAKATVSAIVDQIYTGKAIAPRPVVKVGTSTLKEGSDYVLSYKNNVKTGTATVEIVGKGNYMGSKKTTFNIVEKAVPPTPATTPRLSGATALETMVEITKQGFEANSCSTVVVATMGGYWDALSASALAGLNDCPILLTDGASLSSQAASEIKRLGAEKVYIAGGTAAISSKVEFSLKAISGVKAVRRLAGDVAVNTALEIYKEGKGFWGKTAVVATSETFQDALSVSPYAYAKKAPIFLANASTHKLDSQVLSALKTGGFDRVVIVGGTAALSSQLESQQLKGISCERLAGATAYETSTAIAKWCLTQGMTAESVGVATGESYYDALAGAALCGKNNSALVLVSDANRSNVNSFIKPNKASVKRAYVFGGSAAVSDETYKAIASVLK